MNQARDRDNLLTRLSELARVAFGAIQAGPLAPFRCSAAPFSHAVVAAIDSSLAGRGAQVAFIVQSEVLWI
jgi:hypothetical protein